MGPDRGHLRTLTVLTALCGGRGSVTAMTRDHAGWVLVVSDGTQVHPIRLHGVDVAPAAVVSGLVEAGTLLVIGDVMANDHDVRVRLVHRAGTVDLVCAGLVTDPG